MQLVVTPPASEASATAIGMFVLFLIALLLGTCGCLWAMWGFCRCVTMKLGGGGGGRGRVSRAFVAWAIMWYRYVTQRRERGTGSKAFDSVEALALQQHGKQGRSGQVTDIPSLAEWTALSTPATYA